jgi:predicted RNA-binding protein YlxR (DUF448 family)
MSRGGADKRRDAPERRCLVTGDRGGKAGLIRFVVGPGDIVVPDLLERLPGRGMWVSAERDAIETALRKRVFSRGAKRQVTAPPELVELIEAGLTRRVIELLSLARKSGAAVAGYEKTKAWLVSGEAVILVQAMDGSERGKAKLRPPDGPDSLIEILTGSELGLAFGRENAIHGALAAGGLTTRVVEEAARLQGMRAMHVGDRPVGKGTTTT